MFVWSHIFLTKPNNPISKPIHFDILLNQIQIPLLLKPNLLSLLKVLLFCKKKFKKFAAYFKAWQKLPKICRASTHCKVDDVCFEFCRKHVETLQKQKHVWVFLPYICNIFDNLFVAKFWHIRKCGNNIVNIEWTNVFKEKQSFTSFVTFYGNVTFLLQILFYFLLILQSAFFFVNQILQYMPNVYYSTKI